MLLDGTNPLPEPMLTNNPQGLVSFTCGKFDQKCSQCSGIILWMSQLCNIVSHWLGAYIKWSLDNYPPYEFENCKIYHYSHNLPWDNELTHWGRVTHICISKQIIIGSDNGLSPGRRQTIIWTNAGILLIGLLGINSSEIFIAIYIFSFKKMHLKMLSAKRRPFCPGEMS